MNKAQSLALLMVTALSVSMPAIAADANEADVQAARLLCACSPADDFTLSQMRGGFADAQGLIASIGLERLTLVNGVVISTLNLQIKDLANISGQEALQLRSALASVGIVNGASALTAVLKDASVGTTVIQNSLNNQTVRNATVLNISTNSQQFMKASNLQTTLQDALTAPLVRR